MQSTPGMPVSLSRSRDLRLSAAAARNLRLCPPDLHIGRRLDRPGVLSRRMKLIVGPTPRLELAVAPRLYNSTVPGSIR